MLLSWYIHTYVDLRRLYPLVKYEEKFHGLPLPSVLDDKMHSLTGKTLLNYIRTLRRATYVAITMLLYPYDNMPSIRQWYACTYQCVNIMYVCTWGET